MKRHRWEIALGTLGLAAALAGPALAQEPRVEVNGREVTFRDQPPIERGGRVYIPLRGVLDRLGAQTIDWRPDQQEVYVASDGREVQLWIGRHEARINGQPAELDAPPILVQGRTMVPLRFVSESMGATVSWDPQSMTAYITAPQARVAGERQVYPGDRGNQQPDQYERDRGAPRDTTVGPVLDPVRPRAGAAVAARRPEIVVRMRGVSAPIDRNSIRMRVNGRDVTQDLVIQGNQVIYQPDSELEPGPVHVRVTVRDQQGNSTSEEWTFTER